MSGAARWRPSHPFGDRQLLYLVAYRWADRELPPAHLAMRSRRSVASRLSSATVAEQDFHARSTRVPCRRNSARPV